MRRDVPIGVFAKALPENAVYLSLTTAATGMGQENCDHADILFLLLRANFLFYHPTVAKGILPDVIGDLERFAALGVTPDVTGIMQEENWFGRYVRAIKPFLISGVSSKNIFRVLYVLRNFIYPYSMVAPKYLYFYYVTLMILFRKTRFGDIENRQNMRPVNPYWRSPTGRRQLMEAQERYLCEHDSDNPVDMVRHLFVSYRDIHYYVEEHFHELLEEIGPEVLNGLQKDYYSDVRNCVDVLLETTSVCTFNWKRIIPTGRKTA